VARRFGVLRLAQTTGRPIVAIDCRIEWKIELKSWDRFRIPLLFSRVYLSTAPPIHVPPEAGEAEMEALAQQLAEALGGD
jgi:3-deoxy-D-manno-octulosonic-acid transferase